MICWKIVEIENYKKYANDFLVYYNANQSHFNKSNSFWNQFKPEYYDEYFEKNVSFRNELSKFGIINEIALLFLWQTEGSTLHIDHNNNLNFNIQARLNIPVLNCEGSFTAFYEIPKKYYNKCTKKSSGTVYWDPDIKSLLTPITKVELIQPTIIRTSYPHTVIITENKFPRISLTISFKEDLVKYLE